MSKGQNMQSLKKATLYNK